MKLVVKLLTPLFGLAAAPWLLVGSALWNDEFAAHPQWMEIGGLASIISLAAVIYILRASVTRPAKALQGAIGKIAEGDYETPVAGAAGKDEISILSGAVEQLRSQLKATTQRVLAAQAAEQKASAERKAASDEEARGYVEAHTTFMTSFTAALDELSTGNLKHRLNEAFSRDYENIRHYYNTSIDKLRATFLDMIDHIDGLNSRTQEISSAADALSHRTEQQAASLEETSAALEEITATVKKTADGAQHACSVVSDARNDAEKSSEIVRQAIEAMGRIEKSSQEIEQIITVIDEIAFQTNLLALNAGVEAARAGDAGRGFAVVASEVRALAQRSAEAAREIKNLISASTSQVDEGVTLVAQTGTALSRIVGQVAEANKVVAEIASGAREQSTGLQEVNTAVGQMDQFTQQNAAMVEETTAAGHGLKHAIGQLAELISTFNVGHRNAVDPPAANPVSHRGHASLKSAPPQTARKTLSRSWNSAAAPKEQFETSEQTWAEF
ncbi:MAG: HAMP domain-containing protein [Methylocystis sp.]|nr:HAMP domain-containing protein [Methylocystis sp.]